MKSLIMYETLHGTNIASLKEVQKVNVRITSKN